MSTSATFWLVPRDDILALVDASEPHTRRGWFGGRAPADPTEAFTGELARRGRRLSDDYGWAGECFLYLLTYLQDKGVPLLTSDFDQRTPPAFTSLDVSVIPLTPAHQAYLPQLDPAGLDQDEVGRYITENYSVSDIGGPAAADALAILQTHLRTLRDDEVLLLVLG